MSSIDSKGEPERKIFDVTFSDTGFIYSDKYLEHLTGDSHPERPDRLIIIGTGSVSLIYKKMPGDVQQS